jgi:hypothetical protein
MTDLPTPGEDVPEFLVEEFRTEPPRTLRAISEHARDRSKIQGTPEYVRDAFALQDDQTKRAAAEYAEELAAFLDDEEYDTLEAVPKEAYLDPGEISSGRFGFSGFGSNADGEGSGVSEDDEEESSGFLGLF